MRRTLACLGLLAAALAVTAAPGLTTARWVPRAVDFELAPAGLHAAGRGRLVSPALRAPKRFDLVGLRWRSGRPGAVSVRVRRDGGRWSAWQRLAAGGDHGPDAGSGERTRGGVSDPLWTGGADTVQYRLARPVGGLRLHFVNTTGTATAADRVTTALRRAANGAVLALAGTATAQAGEARPAIEPRSAWGASQCRPRTSPEHGEVRVAFVHHTDTATDYSPDDVPSMILAICRYHRDSNGWNDIGYNFLVDRFGRLWEGRAGGVDKAIVGAQAQGFNAQSTGIANLGTFVSTRQTDAALDAMARLIRWKLPLHGQPTSGHTTLVSNGGETNRWKYGTAVDFERVSGHRDADSTDCPGDALYAQLPDLRERVGSLGPAPAGPAPALRLDRPRARVTAGTLLRATGSIAPAKQYVTVVLERFTRRRFRAYRRLVAATDGDGAFEKGLRMRHAGLYRVSARFGGDASNGPAKSAVYRVRVARRR